ncbi:cyclic peptide export ABC transporter [Chitinophaga rhizophila]|uniref:Cyclic peptide export ABC transporter n=1 Tax=Chitinophaga rhizophila TaxID=2866212 RepID=A0ABS7GHK5_9BACT|nr:cyclic peptide export ABC transporter [Chitinophaga rhizophila]MBW8687172.1 cyclic peptide export ABC transporter [Chitinophaga rhizophila]
MFQLKPKNILFLVAYALPNTLLSFSIVYIINNVLGGNEAFLKDYMGIVFLSLIVYTYLLNVVFQKQLNKFSYTMLYENEKRIFDRILSAPLIKLEKFGSQRFFTAVEDLRTFSFLPYTVTHTVNSLLMLLLCLVYMFTLSVISALIVVGMILMVAGCYLTVMRSMAKQVSILRGYNENYFRYVDDVIKGFKELKLGFFRRENLMNKFLVPNRDTAREMDFRINYVFLSINLISQYGLYFVVGVVLFLLPAAGILERADVISYVVVILFISGPINNLINLQQMYARFMVANGRIKKFMTDFDIDQKGEKQTLSAATSFESLRYQGLRFAYRNDTNDSVFALGPVNLEVKKGEVVFIIGGNGSGKSTFINVLTGLYAPTSGELLLNGKADPANQDRLQQMIAAVFTDNHIFSHNYENYETVNNEEYNRLLATMQLDKIVAADDDAAARRKFSKGQSKRMSLIFALLEKKPVLILDEWAADQDPHFRKFFYEVMIPKLKEEGKTIIAVTHDDAYFQYADRVVKFEYGTIVKDIHVSKEPEQVESMWV